MSKPNSVGEDLVKKALEACRNPKPPTLSKAEARALAAQIRRIVGARPQTASGDLQHEDRQR